MKDIIWAETNLMFWIVYFALLVEQKAKINTSELFSPQFIFIF